MTPVDPDVSSPPTPTAAVVVAVFVGGFAGGLARAAITQWWPVGRLPWATLAINVGGAFVLGVIVEIVAARVLTRHPRLVARVTRPVLGTGFCGAFTTFSSLAVALDTLTGGGRPLAAAVYLLLSVVLGLVAAGTGLVVGRRVVA